MSQLSTCSRRKFLQYSTGLLTGGFGLFSTLQSQDRGIENRPNILFVFPDQMRAQAMGCMGNPDVITPNLDKLAEEGVLMENTYANTPVCSPARACMLTGQFAHKNGMVTNDLRLRESKTTLAEVLQDNGYRTGFVGKWHLDGGKKLPGYVPMGPRRQGYEYWAANICDHSHFDTQYFRDSPDPLPIKEFETETWTDEAIRFLQVDDDRPFFLTLAVGPPHNPYKAPEMYQNMYDPDGITMRPNWSGGDCGHGREEIANYYAMVTAIDDEFGRLMKELDRLGYAENTIVFFTSDHGDMLCSHGRVYKRQPWEESVQVPGIIRFPGNIQANQGSDLLFSNVDYAPTLLGLCNLEVPAEMQGRDLSRTILGESDQKPHSLFFQIFGPCDWQDVPEGWRGVRTDRYKYARFKGGPWVLYDLQQDPYEMNNLVGNPEYEAVEKQMDDIVRDWMTKTGDSWEENWEYPFADNFELSKSEKTFYSTEEYLRWKKQGGS